MIEKEINAALDQLKSRLLEIINPKPKDIKDMSFEEILEVAKPSKEVLAIINYKGDDEEMIGARGFLSISAIRKVYNQGRKLDYEYGKSKYYVWVDMKTASGAGFSYSCFDGWYERSVCGSRLCFFNKDMALLAFKKFPQFWMDMFNIRDQIPKVELRTC